MAQEQPPPLIVRVGGVFKDGPRGLGESDDEAVYYWRFLGEEEEAGASRPGAVYLFRDIDTACAYLEAVWALLPKENDGTRQWSLVRTPLPRETEVLAIEATFVSDYGGDNFLLGAASRFMDILKRMGLASLYRDCSVAVAALDVVGWDATANAAASAWDLDASLVQGFLLALPIDGEEEEVEAPLRPQHWSWRRRGDAAHFTPTDVDYVRRLALHRPVLDRNMSLDRLPADVSTERPIIVERYHYDLVVTEATALGPARAALRLAAFPADGKSRPRPADVESWFNHFLGETDAELGVEESGFFNVKDYRITLAVIALAFGDPLGNAWFACMPRQADRAYGGPPLLCKDANGQDITVACLTSELMAAFGYVHSEAPVFLDWGAERRRGRLFPAVRLRNTMHLLRLEFPYVGTNWMGTPWLIQLMRLVVAQSSVNAAVIITFATRASTPLQSLPPLYRPTADRRAWELGLDTATQVVAAAYRQFIARRSKEPGYSEQRAIDEFITSGLGEQSILTRPHLTRDAFFQESTWMGLVETGTPAHHALQAALSRRYQRPSSLAAAEAAERDIDKLDTGLKNLLLDGIKNLPALLCQGTTLQQVPGQAAGSAAQWTRVLPRSFVGQAGDLWFETLLSQGTVPSKMTLPAAPHADDQANPFRYSLAGSFLVESDFSHKDKETVMQRAKASRFFDVLNNLLDDRTHFPERTPWFMSLAPSNLLRDLLVQMHCLLLHPANALLHRALASGNEGVLTMLSNWRDKKKIFEGVESDNVLTALNTYPTDRKSHVLTEILLVAFMSGQAFRHASSPPSPSSLVERMRTSVMAPFFFKSNGSLLMTTEWMLYEALRIGDLDLLELLAQDRKEASHIFFSHFLLADLEGVSRPLSSKEHFLLLDRRYENSSVETLRRLGNVKARLAGLFADWEPTTHAPRINLDPILMSAKAFYDTDLYQRGVFQQIKSPAKRFVWDAREDYEVAHMVRGHAAIFATQALRLWSAQQPPLLGITKADRGGEAFRLATVLALAGHAWQRRNSRSPHLPDVLLLIKAHWRSFFNSLYLAKLSVVAAEAQAVPLPAPEEMAAALTTTPLMSMEEEEGEESDEDDPFSPSFKFKSFAPAPLPLPPTPPVAPAETEKQKRARLFMARVREAADAPLPAQRPTLPIYTVEQAALLVKPTVPGFWLLPFYTSNLRDRRVSDLLKRQTEHLDARIHNLTTTLASLGALITSFGILARRMDHSKEADLSGVPFGIDFMRYSQDGRPLTTFWSDLSTGMGLLQDHSQLVTMFKTLARERMRLLVTHPTRSKELILPTLKDILSNIYLKLPSDKKGRGAAAAAPPSSPSLVEAFSVVTRSVDEANQRTGDDVFRPVLARPKSNRTRPPPASVIAEDDEIQIMTPESATPTDNTVSFDAQINRALAMLTRRPLPVVEGPNHADQQAKTQIRRLALHAFPQQVSSAPLRTLDDRGAQWIPEVYLGLIDVSLRAAIEHALWNRAASDILLLLVNEPRKKIASPAPPPPPQQQERPARGTRNTKGTVPPPPPAAPELVPEAPMQTLRRMAAVHNTHLSATSVDALANWLHGHATKRESDFGFTGVLDREMLDDLVRGDMLNLSLFFILFGPIPGPP